MAVTDTASVDADAWILIPIFANFFDPDGDAFWLANRYCTISDGSSVSGQIVFGYITLLVGAVDPDVPSPPSTWLRPKAPQEIDERHVRPAHACRRRPRLHQTVDCYAVNGRQIQAVGIAFGRSIGLAH